jgi:hypothetical protein
MNDYLEPKDWWEDYVEIAPAQNDSEEVSTAKVDAFLQFTERLAQAAVDLDLDPTPLNRFRQNAEGCRFNPQKPLPPAGERVHLLLDRLRQKLTRQQRQAAHGLPAPTVPTDPPVAPEPPAVCPVVLRSGWEPPVVRGNTKRVLGPAQHNVVMALLEAGQDGLNKDELVHKSGHSDARGILKRLVKSDSDWADVIHFPGRTGGGYRIG